MPNPGGFGELGFEQAALRIETVLRTRIQAPWRRLTRDELVALARGRAALITMLDDRIDGALLDAIGPELRIVANHAVGFNNIDVAAASARGIVVSNTPGVLDEATATLAIALMLATARRLVEADAYLRAGHWTTGWSPNFFTGLDIDGATLGIVGAGRIGRTVARKARGLGMEIVYAGRRDDPEIERETGARRLPLDTLLAEADVISLHVPLTPETRHLIGAPELARMKPTALLINTARGPIVDEAALVEALRAGRIAGAGLDVFEQEPALAPGLAELANVVIVPHIGSATTRTRAAMAGIAIDNVLAVLDGRTPSTPVNPEVLG